MLPKTKRLTTAAFDQFFKSGRRYHSEHLTVLHTPHPHFHGAVSVGKKVSKKAVTRNLVRRRLYNQLYSFSKEGMPGVFIVTTKPAVLNVPAPALQQELADLLKKIESSGKAR